MSVIKTRQELAVACDQLSTLNATSQSASELLAVLTAAFDGSTNPDAKAALDKLRQAIDATKESGGAYMRAGELLTGYGAFL